MYLLDPFLCLLYPLLIALEIWIQGVLVFLNKFLKSYNPNIVGF